MRRVKKLLWIGPVLLLSLMIGAPDVRADSYTPTFSCTGLPGSDFGCNFVPNGYTAPNVSFPSPTVQVTVGSQVYDVTLAAGDSPTNSYFYSFGYASQGSAPVDTFGTLLIEDLTTGTTQSATDFVGNSLLSPDVGDGTLSFSAVGAATPEPAPIILVLLGAGIIFLFRKRLAVRTLRAA